MALRVPKLLELLESQPPEGWRFGAASLLQFENVTIDRAPWTITRSLHVASGFQTAWDLHPRDPVDEETRDRLVSGAFHTLFHAFERSGYETCILDAPPALMLGFHRPHRTAGEALAEFEALAAAPLADILGARRLPGLGKRKVRPAAWVAPERCVTAVRGLADAVAVEGAMLTLNALLEVPGEDVWFLLAHATAARGKTTLGAVLTKDPGDPEAGEFEELPAARRRKIAATFAKQGYERGENGWFSRTVTARELPDAMRWLSAADVVRG